MCSQSYKKNLTVQTEGFNPTQYLPEVPTFEIYLDMPQDNLITGELFAIYSHGKYNVFLPSENAGNRDLSLKNMDHFFSPWLVPMTHPIIVWHLQTMTIKYIALLNLAS